MDPWFRLSTLGAPSRLRYPHPGTHPPLHPRVTVCTGEAMDEFKQYARGDCGAAGAPCLAHPVGPEMIPRIGVFATPLLVPHTRVSALPESCI